MIFRAFAAGVVSVGVSSLGIYHALLQRNVPYIEYEEKKRELKPDVSNILKYGAPQRSPDVSTYRGHMLCYDQQRRIPHWVAEHVTRNQLTGKARRQYSVFKPDPSILPPFSASNEDYLGSGWTRGHMAPAGNYKYDQDAMSATFFLSNIVPQDGNNNSGYWNQLEIFSRSLSTKYDHVYIISGPLFLPRKETVNGVSKNYVSYEIIGKSGVAVPTHLFKIIVVENDKENKPLLAAFVLPNKPIDYDTMLTAFQVPLEFVDSQSGFLMLPQLDRRKLRNLCSVETCDVRQFKDFVLRAEQLRQAEKS